MMIIHLYIALLGLVIGCFFNVCIYRIPEKQSIIRPPSHCTSCGTRLRPIDLVPVFSYIFLRGRCRYCGMKISARYPSVEVLTAISFVVLYFRYSISVEFFASAFLTGILICISFIDFDHKIIPNGLIILALICGTLLFVYNLFYPVTFYGDRLWFTPLIGLVVGAGFLLLVGWIGQLIYKSDNAMGMGDVKLLAVCGLFLGYKLTIVALFTAIIVAALFSLILILLKKINSKATIAFGPFIAVGVFFAISYGWDIIHLYFSFL